MKNMHASIQAEMAVMPSTLGEALLIELKMLISTRKRVTSKAIRPGKTSSSTSKARYLGRHLGELIFKVLHVRDFEICP